MKALEQAHRVGRRRATASRTIRRSSSASRPVRRRRPTRRTSSSGWKIGSAPTADAANRIAAPDRELPTGRLRPQGGRRGQCRERGAGSRCCSASDDSDPLFLQIKEAEPSVLEAHAGGAGSPTTASEWSRDSVCCRPRATSCSAGRARPGSTGSSRDFYVRQLWDWKFSADIEQMTPPPSCRCTRNSVVGRWRAVTPVPVTASRSRAYLGSSDVFDRASPTSAPPTPTRTSVTTTR